MHDEQDELLDEERDCLEGGECAFAELETRWGTVWICEVCGQHYDDDESEHSERTSHRRTRPYG